MAFTGVAAVIAGGASTAATIAAVGEIGLTLGVVGAVTGNKTLTKIGGVMGLASGVGSLANSAFGAASSAATGVAESTANSADSAASSFSDASYAAQNGIDPPYVGSGTATDAAGSFADQSLPSTNGINDRDVQLIDANGYSPSDSIGSNNQSPLDQLKNEGQSNPPSTNGIISSNLGNQNTDQSSFSDANYAAKNGIDQNYTSENAANQALNGSSYWDKLKNYLNTDKGINSALQLGSGALSGIGKAYETNRNYELNSQLVDLKKQQQANMNDQVKTAGIINNARSA